MLFFSISVISSRGNRLHVTLQNISSVRMLAFWKWALLHPASADWMWFRRATVFFGVFFHDYIWESPHFLAGRAAPEDGTDLYWTEFSRILKAISLNSRSAAMHRPPSISALLISCLSELVGFFHSVCQQFPSRSVWTLDIVQRLSIINVMKLYLLKCIHFQ